MANIPFLDANGNKRYMEAIGTGTDEDPLTVAHLDAKLAALIGTKTDLVADVFQLGYTYQAGQPYSLISLTKTLVQELTNVREYMRLGQGTVQIKTTDRGTENLSNIIVATGVSQLVAEASVNRSYLLIQNLSNADLWIDFGVDAVTTTPSIKISADDSFVMSGHPNSVTQSSVHIAGTQGQAFTAKQIQVFS